MKAQGCPSCGARPLGMWRYPFLDVGIREFVCGLCATMLLYAGRPLPRLMDEDDRIRLTGHGRHWTTSGGVE